MPDDLESGVHSQPPRPAGPFWVAFGFAALAVGAIGTVLPVLPTTPFVLVAAFAFGKGSPRLRRWLVGHRVFGPAIRDWEAHGAIRRRYKSLACGLMALTFTVSALAGVAPIVLVIQAVCMIAAALYILTRPDGPRAGAWRPADATTSAEGDRRRSRRPDA